MIVTGPDLCQSYFIVKTVRTILCLFLAFSFSAELALHAQQSQEIQFRSGYIYQGGRKKGLKQTTSMIQLPDLNEILAPTPAEPQPTTAKTKPSPTPSPKPSTAPETKGANTDQTFHHRSTIAVQPDTSSQSPELEIPRFGYGSEGIDLDRPHLFQAPPIDLDVDEDELEHLETVELDDDHPVALSGPVVQLVRPTTFSHQYYPRSYLYRVPYALPPTTTYYSHGCGGYAHPIYSSRAPLRGTFTSSRYYLGLDRPSFSVNLSF